MKYNYVSEQQGDWLQDSNQEDSFLANAQIAGGSDKAACKPYLPQAPAQAPGPRKLVGATWLRPLREFTNLRLSRV